MRAGWNERNRRKNDEEKKGWKLLSVLCLVLILGLTGCGSDTSDTSQNGKDEGVETSEETKQQSNNSLSEGYLFEANGVTIGVDMDMEPIAKALGEPESVFEEPSCAAQGTAYLYTYPGFQVNTYPDGDTNLVGTIILKDDTVATPEGIDLSKTKEDVIAVYGNDYDGTDRMISYEKDGMKLNFIFDGDNIASIEYNSSVMN